MKYFSTRAKFVKSMEKWKKERATGEWKLIGFGKQGENILEPGNFAPTENAYTTGEIPPELVRAIPDQLKVSMELRKRITVYKYQRDEPDFADDEFLEWVHGFYE